MENGEGEIYGVSTSLVPRLLFVDTKPINSGVMMELIRNTDIEKEKEKLQMILGLYEKVVKDYDNDIKDYYQKLKLIENHYKLYENTD